MTDETGTDEEFLTSVERVIAVPPQEIFDLLADPSHHPEIDGSGSVRAAKRGSQRLVLGSTFTMSMRVGVAYSTVSEVVEYEVDRPIPWQTYSTIKWLARFGGGRIWRYELEPVDGGTLVRETWDITHEGPAGRRTAVKPRARLHDRQHGEDPAPHRRAHGVVGRARDRVPFAGTYPSTVGRPSSARRRDTHVTQRTVFKGYPRSQPDRRSVA